MDKKVSLFLNSIDKTYLEKLSYKILDRNSTSPTILLINKRYNYIYKIWISPTKDQPEDNKTKTDEKQSSGLEYEAFVYEKIFDQCKLKKYRISPFSKVYETSVQNGEKNLPALTSAISDNIIDLSYFYICLRYYISNIDEDECLYDLNTLKNFYESSSLTLNEVETECKKYNYKFICTELITPYVVSKWIKEDDTKIIDKLDVYGQILIAIYMLKKFKIQHNDLHNGNILLDRDKKVYIYDWDRSYVKDYVNKSIDDNAKDKNSFCGSYGNCNIFLEDLSWDFFRITALYIEKNELEGFLKDILGYKLDNEQIESIKIIFNIKFFSGFFKNGKRKYFCKKPKKENCLLLDSHLIFDTEQDSYNFLKNIFGDIDQIFVRFLNYVKENDFLSIMPNFKELLKEEEPLNKLKNEINEEVKNEIMKRINENTNIRNTRSTKKTRFNFTNKENGSLHEEVSKYIKDKLNSFQSYLDRMKEKNSYKPYYMAKYEKAVILECIAMYEEEIKNIIDEKNITETDYENNIETQNINNYYINGIYFYENRIKHLNIIEEKTLFYNKIPELTINIDENSLIENKKDWIDMVNKIIPHINNNTFSFKGGEVLLLSLPKIKYDVSKLEEIDITDEIIDLIKTPLEEVTYKDLIKLSDFVCLNKL